MADAVVAKPASRDSGGTGTIGLLILTAGIIVIGIHIVHPNFAKISAMLGIPIAGVEAAWKFSRSRGLPFAWVLATILVESGGKPNDRGDAGGRSVGLMQVNTVAHANEIAAAGLTPTSLFDPTTNVDWGTRVMKDIYDEVKAALAGRNVRTPIDETLRLAYKGPATVIKAIKSGQEPANISWAPEALTRWRNATARVAAAGGGSVAKLPFV